MKNFAPALLVAALLVPLASCGSKSSDSTAASGRTETPTPVAAATPETTMHADTFPVPGLPATPAAVSKYDGGPRASASPVNAAMAAEGKTLFTKKGCVTCHAFGKKLIGPDLKGVASQRSALWMENQILHPEIMTKEDPISMALLKDYKVPMTNQKLTPAEAKAVIEYIKQMDH